MVYFAMRNVTGFHPGWYYIITHAGLKPPKIRIRSIDEIFLFVGLLYRPLPDGTTLKDQWCTIPRTPNFTALGKYQIKSNLLASTKYQRKRR